MELTDRHITQLLEAVKSTADVATATTAANRSIMEAVTKLSAEVSDLRTQMALSIQAQKQHQEEQQEMYVRLFGQKDDGIIQRLHEKIEKQDGKMEDLRLELATEIEDNRMSSKRTDGVMAVFNGLFAMLSSFLMKQFGGSH